LSNNVAVREAGRKPPPFPFIFFKPTPTIHDHGAPVLIPKIAQNDQADYEGELVRNGKVTIEHYQNTYIWISVS